MSRRSSRSAEKMPRNAERDKSWIQRQGPGVLLVVLTLLVYLPALKAGFIWDDDDYVTQNLTLRTVDGLRRIWFEFGATPQYYPLVHTMFWVEYHLWELWAAGYHAVNIMLHVLNAWLLWRVLLQLGVPGAMLGAALFAVHPVQVESVVWITERKNVLSAFFYVSAFWWYLRFLALLGKGLGNGSAERGADASRGAYVLSLALFVAALLSKTVTLTLPAALLVVIWWKRGSLRSGDFVSLLPFFGAGIVLGLVTVWMEKTHVGATGAEWALKPLERWLVAGRALWFYAGKLVWPAELIFIYPRWKLDTGSLTQHLFPVAALAVMAGLWFLRRRIGRGPLAATLLFAGTLFPALGFFDVYPMRYSFVADHFQYHASAALLAGLGALLAYGAREVRLLRQIQWRVITILVVVLGVLVWRQIPFYRDLETLWRATLAKNPSAGIAHNNLGNLLTERGELAAAEKHYQAAIELDSRDDYAHYNYGVLLAGKRNLPQAAARFRRALEINPGYVDAWFNLGKVLEEQGQSGAAAEALRRGLTMRPQDAKARTALAISLVNLNQGAEAAAQYEESLKLVPDDPVTLFNYAMLLRALEKPRDAAARLEEAVRLRPDDREARQLLVELYLKLGDAPRARTHAQFLRDAPR